MTERQRDNRRRHKEAKERAAAERRQREEQEAVEAKKRAAKKKRENRKAKGLAKKAGDGPAVTQEEAVFSTTAPEVAATRSSDGDTTDEYDVDAAYNPALHCCNLNVVAFKYFGEGIPVSITSLTAMAQKSKVSEHHRYAKPTFAWISRSPPSSITLSCCQRCTLEAKSGYAPEKRFTAR